MDYGFKRPKRLWEASDGAIYLLSLLSSLAPKPVAAMLPDLVKVAEARHYSGWQQLQEGLWGRLPVIANGLGKKVTHSCLAYRILPHVRCTDPAYAPVQFHVIGQSWRGKHAIS